MLIIFQTNRKRWRCKWVCEELFFSILMIIVLKLHTTIFLLKIAFILIIIDVSWRTILSSKFLLCENYIIYFFFFIYNLLTGHTTINILHWNVNKYNWYIIKVSMAMMRVNQKLGKIRYQIKCLIGLMYCAFNSRNKNNITIIKMAA